MVVLVFGHPLVADRSVRSIYLLQFGRTVYDPRGLKGPHRTNDLIFPHGSLYSILFSSNEYPSYVRSDHLKGRLYGRVRFEWNVFWTTKMTYFQILFVHLFSTISRAVRLTQVCMFKPECTYISEIEIAFREQGIF